MQQHESKRHTCQKSVDSCNRGTLKWDKAFFAARSSQLEHNMILGAEIMSINLDFQTAAARVRDTVA